MSQFGTYAIQECQRARRNGKSWETCRAEYCDMYETLVNTITLTGGPNYFGGDNDECRHFLHFNRTLCEYAYRDAEAFCDCVCPALLYLEVQDSCKAEITNFFLLGRRGEELSVTHQVSQYCTLSVCDWFEQLADPRLPMDTFEYGGVPPKCRELSLPFKPSTCLALISQRPYAPCPFLEHSGDNNLVRCWDGHECVIDIRHADSWSCCQDHKFRMQCPANFPVMCEDPLECNGRTEHCCKTSVESCSTGKARECSPLLSLTLPEWFGEGYPGYVPPVLVPETTKDPSLILLESFTTTAPDSLPEQLRGAIPYILLGAAILGAVVVVVACGMVCQEHTRKVGKMTFGVGKLMAALRSDPVSRFVPEGGPSDDKNLEPLPAMPNWREIEAKRQEDEACDALEAAVKGAFLRGSNGFVLRPNLPPPPQEAPLLEAIRVVSLKGLQRRGKCPELLERGERWLKTVEAERRLVRVIDDVQPDLRRTAYTKDIVSAMRQPGTGPWVATGTFEKTEGDLKDELWANVERLTESARQGQEDGANHELIRQATELRAALVARTKELPADRCVLDPDGEGLKLLPVGSRRALWPSTGEAYTFHVASDLADDVPPRDQLGDVSVDDCRPVCSIFVEKKRCHLGRRCPWRHCEPIPGDEIREPIMLEDP